MVDINTITYTIRDFDEQNGILFVEFHDEGMSNIALRPGPSGELPSTPEEMDNYIKVFARHKDMVQVIQKSPDISFIKGMIATTRKTERYDAQRQFEAPEESSATDFTMHQPSADERETDKNYIRQLIEEVLAERGNG